MHGFLTHTKVLAAIGAVAATVLIGASAGCSSGSGSSPPAVSGNSSSPPASASGEVVAHALSPYGIVLTNAQGDSLYVFSPDKARAVTCTGSCAASWPPLFTTTTNPHQIAGRGVKAGLIGTDSDGDQRVVTYNGWPLYTYAGDDGPGYASGQSLDLNGGEWYLINSAGRPVTSG